MRIFPREFTSRLKLQPAFEETLMKIKESKDDAMGSQDNSTGGGTE